MFQPAFDAGYRHFELSVVYDAQTRLFYWDISLEVGRFSREISRGLREFCDFAKTRKQEMFLVSFSLRGSCNDPASDSIPAASSSDCSEVSESVAAQFMGLVLMLLRSCVVPTSVALTRTLGEIFTTNRNVFLFLRNPPFFVPLKYKELFRRDEIFRHTVEANDFKSLQIQARIHAQSRYQRPATLNFLSFSMRSDGSDFSGGLRRHCIRTIGLLVSGFVLGYVVGKLVCSRRRGTAKHRKLLYSQIFDRARPWRPLVIALLTASAVIYCVSVGGDSKSLSDNAAPPANARAMTSSMAKITPSADRSCRYFDTGFPDRRSTRSTYCLRAVTWPVKVNASSNWSSLPPVPTLEI